MHWSMQWCTDWWTDWWMGWWMDLALIKNPDACPGDSVLLTGYQIAILGWHLYSEVLLLTPKARISASEIHTETFLKVLLAKLCTVNTT